MMTSYNIEIDTDNHESLIRIVFPLIEVLKCVVSAINNNYNDAAIAIFSERFISYIPNKYSNLDRISYSEFIQGGESKKLISIFQDLLELWEDLQNYGIIGSDYKPDFKMIKYKLQQNRDKLIALT